MDTTDFVLLDETKNNDVNHIGKKNGIFVHPFYYLDLYKHHKEYGVFLKVGESKEVIIKVKKQDFAYYNIEMKKAVEDGEYFVKLARNAEDVVSTKTI